MFAARSFGWSYRKARQSVKLPKCTLRLSSVLVRVRLAKFASPPGRASVIMKAEEGCPEAPMKDFYMCPSIRRVQQSGNES